VLRGEVEGVGLIMNEGKVDGFEVDAADDTVVHGAIIENPVGEIRGGSPLRGAGDVGGWLAGGEFNADGNVEVV